MSSEDPIDAPGDLDPPRAEPTTWTVTRAARNFSEIVNRAYYRGERFVLTRGGKAVAEIAPVAARRRVTASELRRALASMPHLESEDAEAFARDLEEVRRSLPPLGADPWESS
jgi:antitoxin (DNA-binding transcriptional repressor) of toxin-antitoxin stability system